MQHPQHRHLAQRPLRVEVEPERPLERRERELVRPQSALQRVTPQRSTRSARPDDDPGLGAAEELVAGEADEVGPGGQALPRGGLVLEVHEDARAEVVDERQPWRRATAASSATDGCSVKPTTRKFDWCTRRSTAVSGPIARS